MDPEEPRIATNIKHGSASQLARIYGRKSGAWSLDMPLPPSGTAGTAPDSDPIIASIFGGAGALVGSSTVFSGSSEYQYTIHDRLNVPMTLLGFQKGVAATGNRFAVGCIPTKVLFDFNQNILSGRVQGVSVAVAENETFAVLDPTAQGGLTAFPTIPNSFTTAGSLIPSFGGTLSFTPTAGGSTVTFPYLCDNLQLEFNTGMSLKGNFIDSAYPGAVIYNVRSVVCRTGFVNNDSAALAQLKTWARQNTQVNVLFALGTIAGSRVYFLVNGVQFISAQLQDTNGYVSATFGDAASSVAVGGFNDLVVGFA